MKRTTKNYNKVDFRKPPLRGVFKKVQNILRDDYNRDITIDAVHKAYSRGEPLIFRLVKQESEQAIEEYKSRTNEVKTTLSEKVKYENNLSERLEQLEAN